MEGPRLRLRIDPGTASLEIEDKTRRVAVRGFGPRVIVGGRAFRATSAREPRSESVQTPNGPATRISMRCSTELDLELELAVEMSESTSGVTLELAVENTGESAQRIGALEPFSWEETGDCELKLEGDPGAMRWYRMGYQSWTPAGWLRLDRTERRPRIGLLRDLYCGPLTPFPRRGFHASDCATSLRAPGSAGLSLGFVTHRNYLCHIGLSCKGPRPSALYAQASLEEHSLAPGDRTVGERLWLGLDAAGEDGIATWAQHCGREMNVRVPDTTPSAWCSWYQFFTRVTAPDVVRATQHLADQKIPIDTIQLDDGFQAAVGDWREWDAGFPDGIAPIAKEIRASGFRAGLWLAPLLVSRASNTAREHPDWLLRRSDGKPRVALINKDWKGKICYALDPTHPEVLSWLERIARRARKDGFDYLKLDFLYAGTLPGERYDPDLPSGAAYRGAIEAIRRGAGKAAFLLGCGAPLGPSIGLFEAMRIGPDVAPYWASPIADRLFGVKAAPSAVNGLRNVLSRAALHRRLWLNDPDCAVLRDEDTKLDTNEVRTLAATIAVSGGLLVLSDDPDKLSDERGRLQSRLLPPLPFVPEVTLGEGESPDQLSIAFPDGSVLVLRVNLSDSSRALPIDPVALGFEGSVSGYDVWEDRLLDLAELTEPSQPEPAHGCRLVHLVADNDEVRVIGSTLHLASGGFGVESVRSGPEGRAQVDLALRGERRGKLILAFPGRTDATRVHVSFKDRLSLELEASGVEDAFEVSDR